MKKRERSRGGELRRSLQLSGRFEFGSTKIDVWSWLLDVKAWSLLLVKSLNGPAAVRRILLEKVQIQLKTFFYNLLSSQQAIL